MSHNLELWYVVIGAFSFFEQFVDTRYFIKVGLSQEDQAH